ncbi:MAG: fluoride efflux transporter CrcB [Cyclobacteriaceae bacterium]
MLKDIIFVGLGGFLGSVSRYLVGIKLLQLGWQMPWPTFLINIVGSLIIGTLMALTFKLEQEWKLIAIVGFCGGFTTFSTFSWENMKLWQEGQMLTAVTYAILSLIIGLLAVGSAFWATNKVL